MAGRIGRATGVAPGLTQRRMLLLCLTRLIDKVVPMPPTRAATKRDAARLDATDWILAGLDTLASQGVDAVRVEILARKIGITKGSFYWHFKDRADLLTEMLGYWRRHATLRIIDRLERSDMSPLEKLRQLMSLPVQGKRSSEGASVELAIRLWARSDAAAALAVAEVDQQRLLHMRNLIQAAGVRDRAEAEARAFLIYAYMLAEALVTLPLSDDAKRECERCLGVLGSRQEGLVF
jgi:AcrR family transcriptional regulator